MSANKRTYTEEESRQRKNTRQQEYERKTGYAAHQKYEKNNIKRIALALVKNTDADIIDFLETMPNKAGYIKQLIREDIERRKS